jgi:signal transduction histidine kinase
MHSIDALPNFDAPVAGVRTGHLRRRVHAITILTVAYLLGALLGFEFLFDTWTSTLWPPSGIALAGILIGGPGLWPAVAIGSFLANATMGLERSLPLVTVIAAPTLVTIGNVFQALLGAYLVRRSSRHAGPLETIPNVLAFVALGPVLSTIVGAALGTLALCGLQVVPWAQVGSLWANWWLGNLMGALIFAPLVLAWRRPPSAPVSRAVVVEASVLFGLLIVVAQVVFASAFSPDISRYPLVYLPMPLVGWAALRFGMRGAVTATALLTVIAVRSTVDGSGPFVLGSMVESLFLLQAFDGVSAVATLVLAAVVLERRRGERALRDARDSLEQRVADRTAELRALFDRLHSIREEERTRIAREIHDELGQSLTALKIDLSWLSKRLQDDQTPLHAKVDSMNRAIDATIQSMRRIATELRPSVLDHLGLLDALEWQLQEFQNRTDLECSFTNLATSLAIDPARSTDLFRVMQEALTNVARHAAATRVDLTVSTRAGTLVLELRDDGRGFEPRAAVAGGSMGLVGMRERMGRWHGSVRVLGGPGRGTTVRVEMPLPGDGTKTDGGH